MTLEPNALHADEMPALGLFREVMHERLCDPKLRWVGSDLIDMVYLTVGAVSLDPLDEAPRLRDRCRGRVEVRCSP